ncbi:hypothetical protein ACOMHN_050745 [Nucella lapillus]
MAADVLVFVETRVTVKGCMQLPGFTCIFEDSRPPYGTSVYGKNGLVCNLIETTIKDHTGHIDVTTVSAKKDSKYYIITAVYKSPQAPKQMLMDTLTDSLDKVMPADSLLCISDFNIDRKKNDANAASLVEFMEHRTLLPLLPPSTSTTNQGTQIDQCFTNISGACAEDEEKEEKRRRLEEEEATEDEEKEEKRRRLEEEEATEDEEEKEEKRRRLEEEEATEDEEEKEEKRGWLEEEEATEDEEEKEEKRGRLEEEEAGDAR